MSELEELRDDLADRLRDTRLRLGERAYVEQLNRQRIEAMLQAPEEHKWVVVANEDIGEKGCKHWHSRPRYGLLGMLMGWWRVRHLLRLSVSPGARRGAGAPTVGSQDG